MAVLESLTNVFPSTRIEIGFLDLQIICGARANRLNHCGDTKGASSLTKLHGGNRQEAQPAESASLPFPVLASPRAVNRSRNIARLQHAQLQMLAAAAPQLLLLMPVMLCYAEVAPAPCASRPLHVALLHRPATKDDGGFAQVRRPRPTAVGRWQWVTPFGTRCRWGRPGGRTREVRGAVVGAHSHGRYHRCRPKH